MMHNRHFVYLQTYAESLCRSFCNLLKDITNEGQVQVLKVTSLTHFFYYLDMANF